MKKKKLNYSIGLDIGVGSVGWACLTPEFKVLKHQNRYAIGSREFTSAETAEETRIRRGTRRRYNRRIKRIQLLQQTLASLFDDDPSFFMKSDASEKHFWRNSNHFESNTLSQTLRSLGKNSRTYPTIYHLRHDIISNDDKFDPRLLYMALHHLTKFRGHFLNENMNWSDKEETASFQEQLQTYFTLLNGYFYDIEASQADLEKIEHILKNKTMNNSDKRADMMKLVGREQRQPLTLLVGLKANMAQLFPDSENAQVYKDDKLSIDFSKDDITEVYERLTDEEKLIIDQANVIYQNINLHELLGNSPYVSAAKVKDYNQFGKDLALMKQIYNDYYGEKKYREMFITQKKNKTKYNETKDAKLLCKFDQFLKEKNKFEEKFYTALNKEFIQLLKSNKLKSAKDKAKLEEVVNRLDKSQFLLKQKTYLNAAIPHQNNVYEAETILKNQQKHYPAITDDMIEKVKQIINFRIPYYIGPLVKPNKPGDFGWVIRKKDGVPVLPWNIDEVVDRSASAEQFIQRMTGYCMYLVNEKVLPKHSLLYEKFELLNELNGIQIRSITEERNNKYRLGKEEKHWIIENVFKKRKNVTAKHVKDALKKSDKYKHLIIDENTEGLKELYGTQKENQFSTNLSTYIDMVKIFGKINEGNISMIEEIIYWITVFEDRNIIKVKVKEKYPEIKRNQLKQLLHLNYSGWGRLSKRLIDELPADHVNHKTILDIMSEEPKVFMEVLSIENYQLNERIAKMNQRTDEKVTSIKYQDVAELQGSPALKKSIWQAVLIIEELVDIFGEPDNIMIEFAREDGESRRTESRKKRIERIKKAVTKDEMQLKEFLNEHSKYEEARYNEQRLYLYITQEGKCLYSGESLTVSRLQDYEVDHIYPRSFVPDDSIDNLALVKPSMNQKKSDTKMPLEILSAAEIPARKMYWKKLYDNELISRKKYFRLLKELFTDQDKESFFARQLVETRQITKHVKNLLEERFKTTDIHTVNAEVISNLRRHSNITKIRSLNSKHHAVDAALATIVIQFILNKYGQNFLDFNFKYQEAQKKWRHMMKQSGKNFFLFAHIDKHDKFHHYETGELLSGREFFQVLNDEIPWQTTKKIGTEEAAFYKETLHSPKTKPAKYESAKTKHGVYDEMKTECTYLISYAENNKQGKLIKKSDFVDLYVIEKYQHRSSTQKELALYLAEKIAKGELVDAIIHTKLQKYQPVEVNGYPFFYISSRELHNAKQLKLNQETLTNLYKIINKKRDEEIEVAFLQTTFSNIASTVNINYEPFLPISRQDVIKGYAEEITDDEAFLKGIEEIFKTTSASAARSTLFGARYQKKVNPGSIKFIYESITGLKRRKPKSFRHELWSL